MIQRSALGRRLALGLLLVTSGGCTLILDPARHDDVARCDFDDDCPLADDPRYELYCTVAEPYADQPRDFPKICAPRPAVSCDPREYPFASLFARRHREATGTLGRYDEHCSDLDGVAGCLPPAEGCADGLSPHEASGRCDDDDPDTPPAIAAEPVVAGQDVLDQFCRSVFCDITFACDTTHFRCVPCELGTRIGSGGCGDLFLDGERSTAYQSSAQLVDECGGAERDPADAYVGPIPDENGEFSE